MRTASGVILASLLWLICGAGAQPLPGAGSPSRGPGTGTSHAWVCLPVRPDGSSVIVLHVPARGPGVADGSVSKAAELPQRPERLAAWENRLYIVFPREAAGPGKTQRRVLELSVEPGSTPGQWNVPEEARLPALPSLPGDGALTGLAGTSVGPVALLQRAARPAELMVLALSEWKAVALPEGLVDASGVTLAASADALELIDAPHTRVWTGKLRAVRGSVSVEWSVRDMPFATEGGVPGPAPEGDVLVLRDGYVYWSQAPAGGIQLWSASRGGCQPLRSLPGVPATFSAAPLDGNGRIVVVWTEPTPGNAPASGASPHRPHIVEVSAFTGRVLFDGQAYSEGPMSAQELKLLAAILTAIMAVVLLFVLRPEGPASTISLPRDAALCDPGRRAAAAVFDAALAGLIAARFADVSLADLVSPGRLLASTGPLVFLVLTAGIGFAIGTLGEWMWGRTPGKAMVGCAVGVPRNATVDGTVTPVLDKPSLWRAAARNLIKWVLPPVALSGVFAPARRHRGDVVAGTAVVVLVEDEPSEPGDGADDEG